MAHFEQMSAEVRAAIEVIAGDIADAVRWTERSPGVRRFSIWPL